MRFQLYIAGLLLALPLGAQAPATQPSIQTVESPAVRRARSDLMRVQDLVSTGVLPRINLEQAQNALADAQDESAIRDGLVKQGITVDEAETVVALTQKRVERRQNTLDDKNKLVAQGVIARSEATDAETALANAKRDQEWAESRVKFARELVELAKSEQEIMRQLAAGHTFTGTGLVEHFVGTNHFDLLQLPGIQKAFFARFAHELPVSALGETDVHKALGFDHRNRVDVALQPEEAEGLWLRHYLTVHGIPFFAFRMAVPGKATGAHIHIGPPSERYISANATEHKPSQKRTL
jgi:hypothetical protein